LDSGELPKTLPKTNGPWWSVHGVTRAYWVVLIVLAVLQAVSFYHLSRRERADRRQEASQKALLDLQKLLADMQEAQSDEREFVASRNPQFLPLYARASSAAREAIRQLRIEPQPTAAGADEIERAAVAALDEMDRLIAAARAPHQASRPATAPIDEEDKALQRVREAIARVSRGQEEATGVRTLEEAAAVRRGVITYVMVTVADLVLLALGYWGLQRYVEHRRRVEETLAEAWRAAESSRADAETANRAKDRILATVSHDLRTPLSSIMLWAEVANSGNNEPEVREALAAIADAAQSQARLVEDLLDASRALGGTLRLEKERLDLAEVARRGCDAVRPTAEAKGVTLSVDVPPEPCWYVHGDRLRLQQVVWNVVGNAVKFTPPSGKVDVTLRPDARADGNGARTVVLTVRDTGAGIHPADMPHIFEPFFQADSKERRRKGGIGLGLAIVKQLVERHGGTVAVSGNSPDAGTTFTVTLPLAGEGSDAPEESATVARAGE
jgi:signal transduction histidine kinase